MGAVQVKIVDDKPEHLVVSFAGDLGLGECDEMILGMAPLLTMKRPLVVADVSGVGYMCSLAMGQFVAWSRILKEKGGVLKLAAAQPRVAESIRLAHLDRLMPIAASVAEATGK